MAALHALGLLVKNDRARTLAESKLADPKPAVRAAAAEALGQIGLPASVPALKAMVKDKESEVVFSATSALFHLGDPSAFQVYYAVLTGQRKTGEPLLQSQMEMLKDPNALAKIGFEAGIGFIPFGGMGYKSVQVVPAGQRVAGARCGGAAARDRFLFGRPARRSRPPPRTTSGVVRASAISAIARRGDASLRHAAEARLADEHPIVRFNAAAAVVRLAGAPVVRPR